MQQALGGTGESLRESKGEPPVSDSPDYSAKQSGRAPCEPEGTVRAGGRCGPEPSTRSSPWPRRCCPRGRGAPGEAACESLSMK